MYSIYEIKESGWNIYSILPFGLGKITGAAVSGFGKTAAGEFSGAASSVFYERALNDR